jgi:diguanylate cyclase (GGDEF)-like protein
MFKKVFINWFFNLKLGTLAIFIFVIVTIATMALVNYNNYIKEYKDLYNKIDVKQEKILDLLSNAIVVPLWSDNKEIAKKIVSLIADNNTIVEITIQNKHKVFIHSYFPQRAVGTILTKKRSIIAEEHTLGEVILRVSTNEIEKKLADYIKNSLMLFVFQLILFVLIIAIAYYFKIYKPMKTLLSMTNDIKKQNFSTNYEWQYNDELNQLGKSFQETKEIISKLIITDNLTNTNNRFMLENSLKNLLEEHKNRPLSIAFFDIDEFKRINDLYGFEKGDNLLKALTSYVTKEKRKVDILGRWNGTEFLLIFPNYKLEEAYAVTKNMQETIYNSTLIPALHVTCSFGVTSYMHDEELPVLLKRCDKALFMAKAEGKNRVITL